jgi:hypothetical protein
LRLVAAEATDNFQYVTWLAGPFMAYLLALVQLAVKGLETRLLTREFGPFGDMTRHPLRLFAAVTFNRHIDVARRTRAGMAQDVANIVRAVFVLLLFAILAARVG